MEIINKTNWSKISNLLIKLRSNLIITKDSYNLDILIPTILNTNLKIDRRKFRIKQRNWYKRKRYTRSDICCGKTLKQQEEMAITPTEFLKLASYLIQKFDGKAENWKSFLDS